MQPITDHSSYNSICATASIDQVRLRMTKQQSHSRTGRCLIAQSFFVPHKFIAVIWLEIVNSHTVGKQSPNKERTPFIWFAGSLVHNIKVTHGSLQNSSMIIWNWILHYFHMRSHLPCNINSLQNYVKRWRRPVKVLGNAQCVCFLLQKIYGGLKIGQAKSKKH